ncbi:MAG: hypothetical protein ACHREM_22075 [Polyangiales bacterium]
MRPVDAAIRRPAAHAARRREAEGPSRDSTSLDEIFGPRDRNATPRAKISPPAVTSTFQSLIRDAMRGLEKEFAALVEAKLTDLIGRELAPSHASSDASPPRDRAAAGTPLRTTPARQSTTARATTTTTKPTKQKRSRTAAIGRVSTADLVSSIIKALSSGASLGKSALLKAAGLSTKDAERVGAALTQLRSAGTVVMTGRRRGATYRLK